MTLRSASRISTYGLLRYAILIGALALAATLLLGGAWVRPIHAPSGQPFDSLADHPEYAEAYLPQHVPQRALVVFVVCLGLWVTNLIPMSTTGLLALTLLPLLGVTSPRQTFAYFGNSAVFFIIGVFVMAAAMIRTGLSKRLTLIMLQRFDGHPRLLAVGVLGSAAFLAMWMPEHAVAAMMFPIILEVADSLKLEKLHSGYAKVLFFGLAWGAIIGGVGTFLGGARAPLALELLHETFADADGNPTYTVSFLGWMKASLPLVIILTGVAIFILFRFIKSEVTDITPATRMLNDRVAELGPMSGRERGDVASALRRDR